MFTSRNHYIVTNSNGRRILVVTGIFYVQNQENLNYEDFDAIFVDMSDPIYEVIRHTIWKISPIVQPKCWLKPIFAVRMLEGKLRVTKYLIDGYATHPNEVSMTERIEEIYARIERLEMDRNFVMVKSSHDLYIRLCQYAVSRGYETFTTGVITGLVGGYTRLYTALFESERKFYTEDRALFNKMLLDRGYIRFKRFVEKVHLCPKCNHSHLLFMESCPKCGSSDIKEESVIHHFRCANISPESTYAFGDELRCPKCRKILRHIGVDYDRPSDVYTCNACTHKFFTPEMKVACMGCGEYTVPSELKTYDSVEYEFTEMGIKALVSNTITLSTSRGLQIGYVDFDQFIGSVLSIANDEEEMKVRVILISRIYIDDRKSESIDNMEFYKEGMYRMLSSFRYSQLSYKKKYFYQMYLCEIEYQDSIVGIMRRRHETVMQHLHETYDCMFDYTIEQFIYQRGDSVSDFVAGIQH